MLSLSVKAEVGAQMVLCPEEQSWLGVGCLDRIAQGWGGGQGVCVIPAEPLRSSCSTSLHPLFPSDEVPVAKGPSEF